MAKLEHDERGDHFNVLGQVVNVLREEHQRPSNASSVPSGSSPSQPTVPSPQGGGTSNPVQRTHVRIPAMYCSGITLYFDKSASDSLEEEVMSSSELPLKHPF